MCGPATPHTLRLPTSERTPRGQGFLRTRTATVTLLSGIAVPGLMLTADLTRAIPHCSRPRWPGQPWSQGGDANDLVVCNVVVWPRTHRSRSAAGGTDTASGLPAHRFHVPVVRGGREEATVEMTVLDPDGLHERVGDDWSD